MKANKTTVQFNVNNFGRYDVSAVIDNELYFVGSFCCTAPMKDIHDCVEAKKAQVSRAKK